MSFSEQRFELHDVKDLHSAPLPVLPTPLHISADRTRDYVFDAEMWVIVANKQELRAEASYLSGENI